MTKVIVEIEFDGPYDDETLNELWLNPDNIRYCLEKTCTNTNFKVRSLKEL